MKTVISDLKETESWLKTQNENQAIIYTKVFLNAEYPCKLNKTQIINWKVNFVFIVKLNMMYMIYSWINTQVERTIVQQHFDYKFSYVLG